MAAVHLVLVAVAVLQAAVHLQSVVHLLNLQAVAAAVVNLVAPDPDKHISLTRSQMSGTKTLPDLHLASEGVVLVGVYYFSYSWENLTHHGSA